MGYTAHKFEADNEFTILIPPEGIGTRIAVQRTSTAPANQSRVHIDLIVEDRLEQANEVKRLVDLGGLVVDWDLYPEDPDFVVMSDPDGNQFCIVNAGHGTS